MRREFALRVSNKTQRIATGGLPEWLQTADYKTQRRRHNGLSTTPEPFASQALRPRIATREEEKFLEKLEMDRQLKEAREKNDSGPP